MLPKEVDCIDSTILRIYQISLKSSLLIYHFKFNSIEIIENHFHLYILGGKHSVFLFLERFVLIIEINKCRLMRTQFGQCLYNLIYILLITTIDIFKIMLDQSWILHEYVEIDVIHSFVVVILQYKNGLVFNFYFKFLFKCSYLLFITEVFFVDSYVFYFFRDFIDLLDNFGLKLLIVR